MSPWWNKTPASDSKSRAVKHGPILPFSAKDLDNVLQTTAIYERSKGIVAKEADMKKALGT